MADVVVTGREVSSYGSKMRSTGTFTHLIAADYTIQTGLSRVEWFKIMDTSANDGSEAIYYLNSNTTSDNVPGYEGVVYVDADGATAWGNTDVLIFEAIGA